MIAATYMFFSLIALFIIYELISFEYADRIIEYNTGKLKPSLKYVVWGLVGWLYYVWLCVGLMTDQWSLFILIGIMSIIPKTKLGKTYSKIDSITTIVILLFMLLNKFHFHIKLITY